MKKFAFLLACLLVPPAWGTDDIAYVLKTGKGASVRIITKQASCPEIRFDGQSKAMQLRAKQENGFPDSVCEAEIPVGTKTIVFGNTRLPAPVSRPRRIVVLGDTGCRMKGTIFQDCSDPRKWPFQKIAAAAASFKPDLVIHVGDYLYRESPCQGAGCMGSPYGYGFDSWQADFFSPARALLASTPWVFVRGNHEACFRAGKGWFRYLFAGDYRACTDYTDPYSVPLSDDTQLIVFDSAAGASNGHYPAEFETVEKLARNFPHNFFLSHHPILGFSEWHEKLYPGNRALQSAMKHFPEETDAAFHGHVHLYEALDFKSDYPVTFVNGNSGTEPDEALPQKLPEGAEPFPDAIVKRFYSTADFGFMTLEKRADGWLVTERDIEGKAVFSCVLKGRQCL